MTWKHEIQLRDLDPGQSIEALCRRCGDGYYVQVAALLKSATQESAMRESAAGTALTPFSYLDEAERHLRCHRWGCNGTVSITLAGKAETSAFVGGLP